MPLTMYQAAIAPALKYLTALSGLLDKAVAHCEARKVDPAVLLNSRLFPDMYPLVRQVQVASDMSKGMAARLAGSEVPSFPDVETTFEELKARIAKTVDFIKSFAPSQFDGTEDKEIVLKLGENEMKMTGSHYAFQFAMPNFYFHATTAYDILRHCGVELGKRDFMGGL